MGREQSRNMIESPGVQYRHMLLNINFLVGKQVWAGNSLEM